MSTDTSTGSKDEGTVLLDQAGPIATITLSRPNALNALTWTMYQQLDAHLASLATNDGVRSLIIRGEGKAFAAGTDIQQFQGFTAEDGIAYEHKMEAVVERLYTFPKPTIAAIHGHAVGAGIVIATACDLRYATLPSRLGVPIARTLGNCITLKNYSRLAEAFGTMKTKEMLFTGHLLTASDALQCGFLTAIVAEEQLSSTVIAVAQQISSLAPLTIWATKEGQRRLSATGQPIEFDDVLAAVYGSADFAEGVQAYVHKRKPNWRGQ